MLIKDHLFILFQLNEEKSQRKKDPDFLQEMGSFSYAQTALPILTMDPRKESENKKLNLAATLEMSILKKEKEYKWIPAQGPVFS